ncbi:hypothetical protein NL676_009672 [Syzygium grande]|nr:hypothetical protein NL676_009672 [Syzygium grande]
MIQKSHWSTLWKVTSSFICDPFEREKQRRRATTAEISLLHFNFKLHRRRKQRGHGTGALSRPGLGSEESGVFGRPSKDKPVVPCILVGSNREKANTVDAEGGGSTLLETTEDIRKQSERLFFGNEEMKNTIWRWESLEHTVEGHLKLHLRPIRERKSEKPSNNSGDQPAPFQLRTT